MTTGRQVRSRGRLWATAVVGAIALVAALAITATGFARQADAVADAKTVIANGKPPATIFATTKSTKPLPKGKDFHFSYISCEQPGCTDVAEGIAAAIKGLGLDWEFTRIPTDGTPQGVQNGWKTAVQNGSDAVYGTGWPVSFFQQQLNQLRAKKIPVFSGYVVDKPQKGFYPFGGAKDVAAIAPDMASWVSVKTQGKGNILYVDYPVYPILQEVTRQWKAAVPKYCPGCKIDYLALAPTDPGKIAPTKIVSYLRSHPDINYIVYVYDGIGLGVPAALRVAGLDKKVKIVGESPSAQNLADVASGRQEMTVTQGYFEAGASVVQQAARALSGQAILPNELGLAYWIYDKSSPKTWTGSGAPAVADLYKKYLALWPAG